MGYMQGYLRNDVLGFEKFRNMALLELMIHWTTTYEIEKATLL